MNEVKIGHALRDENGNLKNGKAGDQTGKEVLMQDWYLHSKGWVLLRPKSAAMAERMAQAMEMACKNPDIGYDQNNRHSLYDEVKNKGFNPSKTTKPVETVCSGLIRVCAAYAYGEDIVGHVLTGDLPTALVKTGKFTKYTSAKYCKSSDLLKRGDILCTPVSGHVVMVLSNGAEATGKLKVDGSWGKTTSKMTQKVLGLSSKYQTGSISNQPSNNKKYLEACDESSWKFKNAGYQNGSLTIKKIQKLVGATQDGFCSKQTVMAIQKFLNKKGFDCGTVDGYMGAKTVKAWQKYINSKIK